MLDAIIAALESRSDLLGWTVRHITTRGAQLYSVPDGVECVRSTENERYLVDVLRDTSREGKASVGAGDVTVLPGDEIGVAIDAAVLRAGLVHNPPYGLPAPRRSPTSRWPMLTLPRTWKAG